MRLNRPDGAQKRSSSRRFTWSELVVRGRVELPTFRFSGTRVPAGHSPSAVLPCDPRATSVLHHDRPRQLRRNPHEPPAQTAREAISASRPSTAWRYRYDAAGDACPIRRIRFLRSRAGRGSHGLARMPQVVEPETRQADLSPGTDERLVDRIAAHRTTRPPKTNTRSRPAQLAICSASTGRTCGGIVTVRLPASVFGSASNAAPEASSSTRFRRTDTRPATTSTSSRRSPSSSPRRRRHQAASSTAARYLGVMASTKATS